MAVSGYFANPNNQYWVGNDGNVYVKTSDGVINAGTATGNNEAWRNAVGNGIQAKRINNPGNPQAAANNVTGGGGAAGGGGGGGGGAANTSADDLAFLADQEAQLRGLLGRTDTGLNQGLAKLDDDYNTEKGFQERNQATARQGYEDNRVQTNKDKQSAYGTINKGAYNGARSLQAIIGRASGTGSSAYQEAIPNAVGLDTSSKRKATTETYGKNLQGIDKAQAATDLSFQDALDSLLKQRKSGEADLRSGIEGQRQNIQGQLATNAGQRAKVQGGGYAEVHAAQAPYQAAIEGSKNAVESFFNQFRTPYTRTNVAVATPDLAAYNVDRSNINAQNGTQGLNPDNPYASLLKKKLQEGL